MENGIVVAVLPMHLYAGKRDLFDVPLVDVRHELRKIDFLLFLAASAHLHYLPQHNG